MTMPPADTHGETSPGLRSEEDGEHPLNFARLRLRLAWISAAVLLLLSLVFIPPLINVNRFQRRITSNLAAALGRPVHLDRVRLTLLPLPGFTLDNFVVDEDPAFGYEPILRANEVRATVRISSLWSHHVEFSRITLSESTSVNVVRLPNGRWNFERVLMQASRIEAAPTAQAFPGPAPRFPYIEASGARLNFKRGDEKIPLTLSDADFALWLPIPREWHFRLRAHPARTDVSPADAGVLRLEGTLGDPNTHAASLAGVPIDLRADWQTAPLAGLSRLAVGRDAGLRGEATINLHATGTAARATVAAAIRLSQVRLSDFIPTHLIALEARCEAEATNSFQAFSGIECHWPPQDSSGSAVLIASGSVPDASNLAAATVNVTVPGLRSAALLDWLQAGTPHAPKGFTGQGVLAGTLGWNTPGGAASPRPRVWSGELELTGETLELPSPSGPGPVPLGDIVLRSGAPISPAPGRGRGKGSLPVQKDGGAGFELLPVTVPLGSRQPVTVEGHFDALGYSLRLTGSAQLDRLLALAGAVPQFGEGLPELLEQSESPAGLNVGKDPAAPLRLDLTATRAWGHAQTWSRTGATGLSPSTP